MILITTPPKFQKTVEDYKVVSELLKMNAIPNEKSSWRPRHVERKNQLAWRMGGFSETDGSSANVGTGRGRGGRVGGVFDGADKKSEGFGDLSSSDVMPRTTRMYPQFSSRMRARKRTNRFYVFYIMYVGV